MIIKRSKLKTFASVENQSPPQKAAEQAMAQGQQEMISPKDLTIENMKLQRQIMMNQRIRQRLEAQERNNKIKTIAKIQQAEQKKDEVEKKNMINAQKLSEERQINPAERHWGIVKNSSKPTPPIPMKH